MKTLNAASISCNISRLLLPVAYDCFPLDASRKLWRSRSKRGTSSDSWQEKPSDSSPTGLSTSTTNNAVEQRLRGSPRASFINYVTNICSSNYMGDVRTANVIVIRTTNCSSYDYSLEYAPVTNAQNMYGLCSQMGREIRGNKETRRGSVPRLT